MGPLLFCMGKDDDEALGVEDGELDALGIRGVDEKPIGAFIGLYGWAFGCETEADVAEVEEDDVESGDNGFGEVVETFLAGGGTGGVFELEEGCGGNLRGAAAGMLPLFDTAVTALRLNGGGGILLG